MYEPAVQALRRALEGESDDAKTWAMLASLLTDLGESDEARLAAERALGLQPDNAEALETVGILKSREGDFDASEAHLRHAFQASAPSPRALYHLAKIHRLRPEDGGPEVFEGLLDDIESDSNESALLNGLIGRLYEKERRFDEAFARYKTCADIHARQLQFDPDAYAAGIDKLIAAYDSALFGQFRSYGSTSELPILITGMPRSGTTLVEQILASHPRVCGAGELGLMDNIVEGLAERLGGEASYPDCVSRLNKSIIEDITNNALNRLRSESRTADRVTDKSIGTYRNLGLATCLFPKARIIHCVREPLDTCLSCYLQPFAGANHPYSYDLAHLGLAYREYLRLMEHWRSVLPAKMLEVRYEDVVADQEGQSRRVVEFCGLEWNDACLRFHETERQVKTASLWQVRQPIYRTSIGRWRNFERHLAPLVEALNE